MLQNFLSCEPAEQLLAEPDTLAVLGFAESGVKTNSIPNMLVSQINDTDCVEVWNTTDGGVTRGHDGKCQWSQSKNLQFIAISSTLEQSSDFEQATYLLYKELLDFIAQSEFNKLIRFWNYIPDINHGDGDNENYKRFCAGRLSAFSEHDLHDLQFPAASAVGHYTEGITITALTTTSAPKYHANPRQVDAFKYPRKYGPSSPSFARASTVQIAKQRLCFISGTASILGHDSVHQGDLRLQLYTTNDNILYLLKETGFKCRDIRTLRIYLRDQKDYPECQQIVEELFPGTTTIYSHADICRADLLVEIECYCVAD